MTQEPKRWLDGPPDDASVRAWMQLGAEELAPPDVLARVAGQLASAHGPVRDQGHAAPRRSPVQQARVASALKWIGALVVVAVTSYVLIHGRAQPGSSAAPSINARPLSVTSAPVEQPASGLGVPEPQRTVGPSPPMHGGAAARREHAASEPRDFDARQPAAAPRAPLKRQTARTVPSGSQRDASAQVGAGGDADRATAVAQPAQHDTGPIVATATPTEVASGSRSTTPAASYSGRPDIRGVAAPKAGGTQREELQQLELAQLTLRADPARALAIMQRHAASFPESWVAEERDALIIRAYVALRDRARAHAALARFAKRYPESPQLRQLEQTIGLRDRTAE